jgi:FkbH-like protein
MSETAELIAQLTMPGITLTKTIAAVNALEALVSPSRHVTLGVSANVSVDLMSVYLRKHALLCGTRIDVSMGNHDDPVSDVDQFVRDGIEEMVFLPFFDNLMPAFEKQIELIAPDIITAKEDDLRARLRLVFQKARAMRQVYVCSFHRFLAPIDTGTVDAVGRVLERFNALLRSEAESFTNVRVLDSEAIVNLLGTEASFDTRFYLRGSAPYALAFVNELARRIVSSSRGFNSYFFKALVLDCDNTLWGGIVGEDLIEGIKLDPHSYPGNVYWRAQQDYLALEQQGVLLCLCSKNNPKDVDEVLEKHPFSVLRKQHLAIHRLNWSDKVGNLQAIARDLNIGLDSLVFVDDSDFECSAVRAALPMVRVFQVPKALSDYPRMLRELRELFLAGGISAESRSKTAQYRQRQEAVRASAQFATHEEYLASLDLRVALARNDTARVARISELMLKSNQFNLTTLRQSSAEIEERMNSGSSIVYALNVSDRFGNAGLTGVAIVRYDGAVARLEAFLMSCRVIGRGVELSIWPTLVNDARRRGCSLIEAEYRSTAKNAQVADFYQRVGLPLVSEDNGIKRYRAPLETFSPPTIDWIKVTDED